MQIDILTERDVDTATDAAICALQVVAFPYTKEFLTGRHYKHHARPDDFRVLAWDGSKLASQAVFFRATARGQGQPFPLVGIGNVCTDPACRGRGLASACMKLGLDRARQEGMKFALLFCGPQRETFYASLGFTTVKTEMKLTHAVGTSYVRDHRDLRMVAPLSDAQWPAGELILDVDDF